MIFFKELKSLKKTYVIIFLTLAGWVIFAYVTMNELIDNQKNYAKLINISGKQRMLLIQTQMSLENFFKLKNKENNLNNLIIQIKNNHNFLINNLTSEKIRTYYFDSPKNINKNINIFFDLIDKFKKDSNIYTLTNTLNHSNNLLLDLNFVVKSFENESNLKTSELKRRELYILIGTLLTLFLEAIFIVIPVLSYYELKKIEEESERKEFLNTIKEDKEKLKYSHIVFENMHDGIMITDSYMKIINVNKAFEKSTGYSFLEIVDQTPKILQSGMYDKKFYEQMWDSIRETGFWEGELVNKKKDGDLYIEWITISVVYDEDGSIKNYIGVFSDLTEQKKQEQTLKEQEKVLYQQSKMAAMGEMIGNIAHQWRQPLSIISTISTGIRLQRENNVITEEEEFIELDKINESAQFLSKTIDDFRDFLKTDKEKTTFEISEVLRKSINIISSQMTNLNIEIILNTEEVFVEGLKNELQQVYINLLNNAKDALIESEKEEKLLIVDIYKEKDTAVILLKDNAGGIPENIIDRIFEPYFTTKHQSQGTGIGLYMCEEMVNNHMNGILTVSNIDFEYNTKRFRGACFKVILPLSES